MTSSSSSTSIRSRAPLVITAAIIARLVILFFIFAGLYTDVLWSAQLGFLNVLTTQWIANVVLFLIGFVAMSVPVFVSIQLAYRMRTMYAKLNSQLVRYQEVIEPLRRLATYAIPALLGLFAGITAATQWKMILMWLNRTPAGTTDPQFGFDIAFYLFDLPFYQSVLGFASAVVLISALLVLATSYLYGSIRLIGREILLSKAARVQIAVTAGVYLLLQAGRIQPVVATTGFSGSENSRSLADTRYSRTRRALTQADQLPDVPVRTLDTWQPASASPDHETSMLSRRSKTTLIDS